MSILIRRKAALISAVGSLPFVGTAAYFCLRGFAETFPPEKLVDLMVGFGIYLLGSPLTPIGYFTIRYSEDALGWKLTALQIVCVLSLLFTFQWICWSQLIVLAWRKFGPERFRRLSAR